MDESTNPNPGLIDMRTMLLDIIGSRLDGVSRQELSRKMYEKTNGGKLFDYEQILAELVVKRMGAIFYCGLDNHRTTVYTLRPPSESEDTDNERYKTCRLCNETKVLVAFRKRPDSRDGRCGQCRKCENIRRRKRGWDYKPARTVAADQDKPVVSKPVIVPTADELKPLVAKVRAESIAAYQKKLGGGRYVVVDDKAILAPGRKLSPVEEYNRATRWWRKKAQ